MATTINSSSVSLSMNASGFIDQTRISRSEARQLTKDIEAARTPLESYVAEHDKLRKSLESGAISEGVYLRLLESKREKYGQAEQSTLDYAKSLAGPLAVGLGTIAAATTGAIATGVKFVEHLKATQDQIDSVADAAGKLGIEYNALIGLRFAAQEAGGVEASAVDIGIRKMQLALAKGSGAFSELGLNSEALKASGAVAAFNQIADKMSQIADHADRLRISTEIFGKGGGELVSTLESGRESIAESVDFMQRWSGLSDSQVLAVQKSNDAWDRIGVVVDGISAKLAGEFAAAMLMGNEKTLSVAEAWNGIDETITKVVDNVVYQVGSLKDLVELFLSLKGIAVAGAFEFDSGVKALDALYAKRADLEREASTATERRQQLIDSEEIDSIEKIQKEINEASSERIQRETRQRLDMEDRLARSAMKNAEEKFKKEADAQRKLREEIAKGPGGGMEAGSAEAARFMADQANAAIAASAVQDQATPTDEQLLEEARKQYEQSLIDSKKQDEMKALLEKLVAKPSQLAVAR